MEFEETTVNNSCFICDQYADPENENGVFAVNTFSKKSGKDYYSLLQNIIGDQYKLTFVDTDVICHTCTLLIEELDALQTEATAISIMLNRQVYRKYNIGDDFELNEQEFCDSMIIYTPRPEKEDSKLLDKYACNECNIVFDDVYMFEIHKNEMHIDNPRSCSRCKTDGKHLLECSQHNATDSNNDFIQTEDKTSSVAYLIEEINPSDSNNFIELVEDDVSKVDSKIGCKVELEVHKIKHGRRKFSKHKYRSEAAYKSDATRCIYCDSELPPDGTICTHSEAIKNGLKLITCKLCNSVFYKNNCLQVHLREFHFSCSQCNEKLKTFKHLVKHENSHKNKAKHECSWCFKVFNTRYGLIYHIPKHTGQYKYFCKVCNRGFMHSKFLEEHMGVHTKADKYICDVCGRKFSFNATYRLHRLWHDNPYPYECKDCGKKFKHTSVLSVHRKTVHTGERPHICNICNKSFVASSTLKRHMMIHTGDYRYKCTICDKGYTAKQKYGKHMAKVHNDYTYINNKIKCEYRMAIPPPPPVNQHENDELLNDDNNEKCI